MKTFEDNSLKLTDEFIDATSITKYHSYWRKYNEYWRNTK